MNNVSHIKVDVLIIDGVAYRNAIIYVKGGETIIKDTPNDDHTAIVCYPIGRTTSIVTINTNELEKVGAY